jgi:hypothetical protein
LLDQAIEHCRYTQHTHPFAAGLRYLYLSHWARAIRSAKQFFPVAFPVLLAVSPQFIDGHTIDTSGTFVANDSVIRLQHVAAA